MGIFSSFWISHQYYTAHDCSQTFGSEKCRGYRYCTAEFTDFDHKELYCTNNESEYLIKHYTEPSNILILFVWPLLWVGYGFCPPYAGSC